MACQPHDESDRTNLDRLRLSRRAGRRLAKVLRDCRLQMRQLAGQADTYSLITGLARTAQKWSLACHLLSLHGDCYGQQEADLLPDGRPERLVRALMAFADEWRGREDLESQAELAAESASLTARLESWCRRWPKNLTINATRLQHTRRYWIHLRNTWTPTEHHWQWNEWPQPYEYLLACPHDRLGCADGQQTADLPLSRLACLAAARLHRAYAAMVERFLEADLYQLIDWRMTVQLRLDTSDAQIAHFLKLGARHDTDSVRTRPTVPNPPRTRKGEFAALGRAEQALRDNRIAPGPAKRIA